MVMNRRYDYTDYVDEDTGLVLTGRRRFDWWVKEEGVTTKILREERTFRTVGDVEWIKVVKYFTIIARQERMNFNN